MLSSKLTCPMDTETTICIELLPAAMEILDVRRLRHGPPHRCMKSKALENRFIVMCRLSISVAK